MKVGRLEIKRELEAMVESQRHRDFQRLAVHLVKRSWPELQATEEQNDGGEDATSFGAGADGLRRSMAASLTGTLAKIRADAKRIKERGVNLGVLIFVTPVPVDNLTVTEWRKSVAEEFKHDLYVISQAEIITRLEQPENHRLCKEYLGLAIEADPSIAELERAVRQASANVLRGWKAANRYDDTKTIELTLFELPPPQSRNPAPEFRKLSLRDIFALVRQRGNGTLLGDPGAGKTFTLIQLAELLLQDSSAPIPILVPLAAWASSGHEFFSFLAIQLGISADAVAKLATLGSFAFLLNGWNEISEAGLERATAGLKTLPLNFPALPLIVSTRNSLQAPPFATPFMIQVAGLSHEQKVTIIRKSGLRDSAALIAELEANNSLLEITDTPLFLSASIAVVAAGERLPQSRYAILQLFVEHFEGNPDHAAGLKGPPCNSLHRQYLERIAVKMTESSGATLTFDEATDVIAQSSVEFQQRGHIGEISPSADILDRLVRHHMLVLTPNPGSSYRFAHQQYQEWFGAEALRHSIGEIIQNETAENRFAFQRDVLNRIQWVEPLLFLMDRLGGGNEAHLEAAARVIRWSMQVDLHLASELAGAAGRAVWGQVRDELGDLLRRWYEADGEQQRYCALSAMLATEAPDFQDILWPLLESTDRNIRLFTIRTRRNFPLSCLGPDWRAKFANWPAERQVEFIRELSWQSNREHIDFAVDILQTGKEPQVNVACFELLLDARAYETLAGLIGDSDVPDWPDGLIERVVSRLPKHHLRPFVPRLKASFSALESFSARRVILLVLNKVNDSNWLTLVKTEIETMLDNENLDFRPVQQYIHSTQPPAKPNGSPCLVEYFELVSKKDPEWAAGWLATQLSQGRFWWDPFTSFIASMSGADIERVAASAVDSALDVNTTRQRVSGLAASGAQIGARVVLQSLLQYERENANSDHPPGLDRGRVLQDELTEFPVNVLVDAVLEAVGSIDDFPSARRMLRILSLARLSQASQDRKDLLRALVFKLDEKKPKDYEALGRFRSELVDVLGMVGSPNDASVIEAWVHEDIQRLSREAEVQQARRDEWMAGGRKGPAPVWVLPCCFWNDYQRALVHLGGQETAEVFNRLLRVKSASGFAAIGLYQLTLKPDDMTAPTFGERFDYFGIGARQKNYQQKTSTRDSATNNADAIVAALEGQRAVLDAASSKPPPHELRDVIVALAALSDERALEFIEKLAADKHSQWTVTHALHTLTLNGVLLPGKEVSTILEPVISESENANSWGSNQDHWHLAVRAIAVLLFSDTPLLGIERIKKVPDFRLKNYYARDLLVPLAACRAPEAIDLILRLALRPDIYDHFHNEAATVLTQSPNPDAIRGLEVFLEKLCIGELSAPSAYSDLPRALAQAAKKREKFWRAIKDRCAKPRSRHERNLLFQILSEVESNDAANCACELMNDEFPVGFPAEHLIETAATQHVPTEGIAFYIKPREATVLKKRLLNIAFSDIKRRNSALHLLGVIERCRLEHGWPANEPLHPDVGLLSNLGAPWQLM